MPTVHEIHHGEGDGSAGWAALAVVHLAVVVIGALFLYYNGSFDRDGGDVINVEVPNEVTPTLPGGGSADVDQ